MVDSVKIEEFRECLFDDWAIGGDKDKDVGFVGTKFAQIPGDTPDILHLDGLDFGTDLCIPSMERRDKNAESHTQ